MRIAHISVNRPITTMMFFVGIVILGLISWSRLPQELFPTISYPEITVVTNYENASPEEIENLITKIVEEAVGTVNGVKRIKSFSKEGISLVIIEFSWGTKMDFAALNVREKIDLVKERLPREADDPIVMKYNPFELPIMNLAITSEETPSVELREMTRKYIKEAIEKIEGVANATITGGDIREIMVEIDQARLHASQISIVEVVDNLKNANLNYPAGTIKESIFEYLIRTMGEFQSIDEIKDTPTALEVPEEEEELKKKLLRGEKIEKERRLVFLRDIGTVFESTKEQNSIARYNQKDSISLVIRKQSGVNTLKVAETVRSEIKKLQEDKLPPDVSIKVSYDQSTFIKDSITNLRNAAIQGGVLALIVLLFFLRHILSSLTVALSIPISLMATFCLMYFSKINLNMMSLGGLALGVGMLVDNSIVVIENIFRHRQMDKSLASACADGAQEVFPPILGSTMTTVFVFLPFAFVVGIAGQIFKQLSFTIAFSLVISIVVAVSLIPVVISLGKKTKKIVSSPDSAFHSHVKHRFTSFLSAMMKIKWLIILMVSLLFAVSVQLLLHQERRFLPEFDRRQFIVKLDLPPGTTLEITDSLVQRIENKLFKIPDIKDVSVNIGSSEESSKDETMLLKTLGSHQAQILVNLDKLSRKKNITLPTKTIIAQLKKQVDSIPELAQAQVVYVEQETSLSQAVEESAPVAVAISGPNLSVLAEIASQLKKEMKGIDGLYSVKTSLVPPTPETKLQIIKDKASLYGLSVRDIAVTAQVALKGYVATQFKVKDEEKDIDIRVRLRPKDRANLTTLRRMLIRSPLKTMVPLSEVAYLIKGTGPTEIQRINLQRTILVSANILNRPMNEIIKDVESSIEKVSGRIRNVQDYTLTIAGEHQKMQESFKSLSFALILAIVLVYMIMASEFESLWQPFIIMFTVPLSLIGVSAILYLTHTSLSVVAYLGIIMLGGIVVNNGIVLVDFINTLRERGLSIQEAAIEGASVRLRPILMTSLTTILGMIPLALGIGEGSELRAPLALTVIGGLFSSAFLTLVFIPAVYIIFNEFLEKFKNQPLPLPVGLGQKEENYGGYQQDSKEQSREEEISTETDSGQEYLSESKESFAPEQDIPAEDKEQAKPEPDSNSLTEDYFAQKMKDLYPEKTEKENIPESEPEKITDQDQETAEQPEPEEKPAEPEKDITPEPDKERSDLNERQQQLLEMLKTRQKITRTEYAKMFGISIPTAARDLKFLTEKGFIIGKGPLGPGRWYELKG